MGPLARANLLSQITMEPLTSPNTRLAVVTYAFAFAKLFPSCRSGQWAQTTFAGNTFAGDTFVGSTYAVKTFAGVEHCNIHPVAWAHWPVQTSKSRWIVR